MMRLTVAYSSSALTMANSKCSTQKNFTAERGVILGPKCVFCPAYLIAHRPKPKTFLPSRPSPPTRPRNPSRRTER